MRGADVVLHVADARASGDPGYVDAAGCVDALVYTVIDATGRRVCEVRVVAISVAFNDEALVELAVDSRAGQTAGGNWSCCGCRGGSSTACDGGYLLDCGSLSNSNVLRRSGRCLRYKDG